MKIRTLEHIKAVAEAMERGEKNKILKVIVKMNEGEFVDIAKELKECSIVLNLDDFKLKDAKWLGVYEHGIYFKIVRT